jgi:hypothetical protein
VTKNEIVAQLYKDGAIRGIIRAQCYRYGRESLREELLHHLMEVLLEQPEERIIQLHQDKRLSFFCYGVVKHCLVNPRDKFAKQNFQFEDLPERLTVEEEPEEDKISFDDFKNHCLQLSQHNDAYTQLAAKVTYGYIIFKPENCRKSYRSYAKETGINYSSICEYIKLMRTTFYEKHPTCTE